MIAEMDRGLNSPTVRLLSSKPFTILSDNNILSKMHKLTKEDTELLYILLYFAPITKLFQEFYCFRFKRIIFFIGGGINLKSQYNIIKSKTSRLFLS